MANRIFGATDLIGGTAGCLDAYDPTDMRGDGSGLALQVGDKAIAITPYGLYVYTATGNGAAGSWAPYFFPPAVNPGNWLWEMIQFGRASLETSLVGAILTDVNLKDYSEAQTAPSSSAGTLTLNIATGNNFEVTLTENVTTFSLTNPSASGTACSVTLVLHQGSPVKTIAWPASIKWPGAEDPDIATASAIYILTFMTFDGGTVWYGFLAGSEMG